MTQIQSKKVLCGGRVGFVLLILPRLAKQGGIVAKLKVDPDQ